MGRRFLATLGLAGMLAGCQTMDLTQSATADRPGHVAHVYVAAYPPVPWSSIAPKLSPANNLTIDQARAMVAAPTQAETAQFLSSFAAGLNLSIVPPSAGAPSTSSSGIPSAALPATAPAPDLSKLPPNLAVNGGTLLQEGTALFQHAQILDNQISNQVLPSGYRPFLMTFQFDVQPHQANLDYDAYTDLTLVPADVASRLRGGAPSRPAIRLFPVIISDASEITSVGRSVQSLQQADFALTATLAHVGAAGGLGRASDKAAMIVGPDRNNLVTAGRVTDNTVRIRFGAINSGRAGRALIAGTYNISFLLLVDGGSDVGGGGPIGALAAVSHTSFNDAHGNRVEEEDANPYRDFLSKNVCDVLHRYKSVAEGSACPSDGFVGGGYDRRSFRTEDARERPLNLLRHVDRQDFSGLDPTDPANRDVLLQRMIAELQELQVRQRYGEVSIQLPQWLPTLPESQIALLADDGKQSATVALRNGRDLDARQIRAAIRYADGASSGALLPTSVSVSGGGSELDLTFPSAALVYPPAPASGGKAGHAAAKPAPRTYDGPYLTVRLHDPDVPGQADEASVIYMIHTVRAGQTGGATAANPVQVTSTVLVPDADGRSQVTLHVGAVKDVAVAGSLHLVVNGADVRNDVPGALAASVKVRGVDLAQQSAPILELANLVPGQTVTLQTVDDGPAPQTAYGTPIVLTVATASPRK